MLGNDNTDVSRLIKDFSTVATMLAKILHECNETLASTNEASIAQDIAENLLQEIKGDVAQIEMFLEVLRQTLLSAQSQLEEAAQLTATR